MENTINSELFKASNAVILGDDNGGKGRLFQSRFLQAGLVKYNFGVCLLTNEAINQFVYQFVGCPVIIDHKEVTDKTAKDDRVGVISRVWFNELDGWFYCEGVIFDDEAISLIKDKNYNVSCQYAITDYSENTSKALHNGNEYDKTILNGKPEHLAIVKNPRYEQAMIAVNKQDEEIEAVNEIEEFKKELLKAKNGWITRKTGIYTKDENGNTHAEVEHIWIEESIQPTEWKKWNKKTFSEYKEGDETKYEFNRTRAKVSEEHQKLIKDTVKEFNNRFKFKPIAAVNVMGLEEGCMGLCSSRINTSTVTLSPTLFNGKYSQKDYDKSVKNGFHPKGTGDMVKSVLYHELGHSITVNAKEGKFWEEAIKINNEYMKNIKPKDIDNPDFISNYARVNHYEFVAEAFCQGMLSKKQGKYTKQVMELIEKHFGKAVQQKLAINEKDKENENDFEWVEEFGGGYPIDEKAYEEMKKKQNKGKDNKASNSLKEVLKQFIAINEKKNDNVKDWITVNGHHIPILEGEFPEEAVRRFFKEKEDKELKKINKEIDPHAKKEQKPKENKEKAQKPKKNGKIKTNKGNLLKTLLKVLTGTIKDYQELDKELTVK